MFREILLEARNDLGCLDTASLRLEVTPVYRVYAPNAFSPNLDGINDVFTIFPSRPLDQSRLHIYDRWGNLLFASAPEQLTWNGQARNQRMDPGLFIWTVDWVDYWGDTRRVSGEVQIVR